MLNLLRIEWLKVRTYKTFWLLFLGFVLAYPATFYMMAQKINEAALKNLNAKILKNMISDPFSYPKVWHSASYFGGLFFLLLGMLFILLITNEVQYRTHRQNIIDGWSRMEYLMAKFQVMLVLVFVGTAMVTISGYWVGQHFSKSGTPTDGLYLIGYFLLMALEYMMVAFLLAILVKRTGLAIILYFAFVAIVDNFAWLILTMKSSQAGYFLPLECVDSLLPNPFKPKLLEQRTVADSRLVWTALGYIVVWAGIIVAYFRKSDLRN